MKTFRNSALAAVVLVAIQPALAAAAEEEKEPGLSGSATFGLNQSRGNTDNLGIAGDLVAEYNTDGPWVYDGEARFMKREEENVDTEERYDLRGTANYYWTEDDYFYARLQWRKDLFGGVREEWLPSVGYGRVLIDNGTHYLKGEIGAGYRWAELADGTEQDGVMATAGLGYVWTLSDSAEFFQNLRLEWSQDNTYLESETGLRTTIVGNLGFKASYLVKHNTDVAPGTANSDFYTTVGLDYAF
ncbi:MAG: DUF481 domain-containing protein [Gammaproteobacteria bacterium]